jgi:hypothetical protein
MSEEPLDEDWLKKFKEKNEALRQQFANIRKSIRHLTHTLRTMHAEFILDDLKGHPEKQQEFIDKLYNPFYAPTPVEEIVIQKLLEKEKDGKDL